MSFLARIYRDGKGVPQDYVQAHKWFNLSASRLTTESVAKYRREDAEARDSLAKHMTAAQIAEAQRLAREWKPK